MKRDCGSRARDSTKRRRPWARAAPKRSAISVSRSRTPFIPIPIQAGNSVLYAGEPAGLIIRMPGGFTVYHAGDTCLFSDMKLIGELYRPDLAMLPIGDYYTMGPREAAHAIRFLGVKHVIPMHYGTFPVLAGTPEELRKEARDIAGLTVHALKPGEHL